jgi:hypothetical protein
MQNKIKLSIFNYLNNRSKAIGKTCALNEMLENKFNMVKKNCFEHFCRSIIKNNENKDINLNIHQISILSKNERKHLSFSFESFEKRIIEVKSKNENLLQPTSKSEWYIHFFTPLIMNTFEGFKLGLKNDILNYIRKINLAIDFSKCLDMKIQVKQKSFIFDKIRNKSASVIFNKLVEMMRIKPLLHEVNINNCNKIVKILHQSKCLKNLNKILKLNFYRKFFNNIFLKRVFMEINESDPNVLDSYNILLAIMNRSKRFSHLFEVENERLHDNDNVFQFIKETSILMIKNKKNSNLNELQLQVQHFSQYKIVTNVNNFYIQSNINNNKSNILLNQSIYTLPLNNDNSNPNQIINSTEMLKHMAINKLRSSGHNIVSRNETMTISDFDEQKYTNTNLNNSSINII